MFNQKVAHLSGGWRARVKLAHVLCTRADVLLLDEALNAIDLRAMKTLEQMLCREGAGWDTLRPAHQIVVCVSHGRCRWGLLPEARSSARPWLVSRVGVSSALVWHIEDCQERTRIDGLKRP